MRDVDVRRWRARRRPRSVRLDFGVPMTPPIHNRRSTEASLPSTQEMVRMTTSTMDQALDVEEGSLPGGLPYFAIGNGPDLVVLRGFTTTHTNPTGMALKFEIRMLRPLARHFRVYAVNRPPSLPEGVTMADIATMHAHAIRARFGGPVDLLGMSSGGSVALQVAADHPDVVRRLVLVGAAARLGDEAREAQRRYIEATAAGRRGAHHLAPMKVSSRVGARLLAPLMWLLDPLARPKDPRDMVAFGRAEDRFDLSNRLADVTAPTLVIGGDRDEVYGPAIFAETAEGVRDGTLVRYPKASHGTTFTAPRLAEDVASFLER
jgi:pimeloyl-ACP methyl ester carboxylesterase